MAGTYQLLVDGEPVEAEFYPDLSLVEVEENVDLPGAIQLELPVNRSAEGDLTLVGDARFRPFANIALVAQCEGDEPHCLFDGFVLSHKVHLERGVTSSTVRIWGQDSEWLMNLEEKTREWVNLTDTDVASAIFSEYGIAPAAENANEASTTHTEDGHSLMQRGSDIQFLRRLARASGKVCRIACGDAPGTYTGYFVSPQVDGDPTVTLNLNSIEDWTVDSLDIEWEVTRPTMVRASQALFNDATPEGVSTVVGDSGLALLDERSQADFAGKDMTVLLTAAVDDAQELDLRAAAVLREAGWLVRCEGEVNAARLNTIIRAGTVVAIEGIGNMHSGKYFVWSVRHSFTADAHMMRFVLVRNALGPESSGGGPLGGLL